jgi:molybdate transport system substrate-binding protein
MRRRLGIVFGLAVGVALAACSVSPTPSASAPPSASPVPATGASPLTLTIYAASSLKTALAKMKTAYETSTPGVTLVLSTDSSAALETKIEQGAPADVFLSADTADPKKLVDANLATGQTTFARNLLAVIVPKANPAGITGAKDLAEPGIKIVAAGDGVPITKYATQLVSNLAGQPGFPDQFASRYALNIVSKEDNVAAVVAKIELGEGDAAIVYRTDAQASTKVTVLAVPDEANVPATYAGVVVSATHQRDAARAFLAWVAGPDGQAILGSLGFLPPS